MHKDIIKDINVIKANDAGLSPNSPSGTFIPKKDAIIVGTEKTIVIPARNFIITFKLFDIIELYVSIVDDKISL